MKKAFCLFFVLCLLMVTGCVDRIFAPQEVPPATQTAIPAPPANTPTPDSPEVASYGTRQNPLGLDETVVASAAYDSNGFTLEVTLKDTLRGQEANQVFQQAIEPYVNLDQFDLETKEILIAKLHVKVISSKNDNPVHLDWDDVTHFSLVSGSGVAYTPFLHRQFVAQNLFSALYQGGEQTANMFYLVDKGDRNPVLNILGNGWFKTTEPSTGLIVNDTWKAEVIDPYVQPEKIHVPEGNFGGTSDNPLPIGEMGLFVNNNFVSAAAELRLNQVLRGKEAKAFLLKRDQYIEDLAPEYEYLCLNFTINLLKSGYDDKEYLSPSVFKLVSASGKAYDNAEAPTSAFDKICTLYTGGTQTGWAFFVVEKSDEDLRVAYMPYGDKGLWFTLNKNAVFKEGTDKYVSTFEAKPPIRDLKSTKGSKTNPYRVGDKVHVDVSNQDKSRRLAGEFCIQTVYTGRAAKAKLLYDTEIPVGSKLVVFELSAKVESLAGKDYFSNYDFTYALTGGMAEYPIYFLSPSSFAEGLGDVYPGTGTKGLLGLLVRGDDEFPLIGLNVGYDSETVWFELFDSMTA